MHAGDMDYGALPAIAIVGGGIPVATGIALAFKSQKRDNVAVCFFGDGATNEGAFHEAVNMGAIWNLPIVYVCENNFYGASTHVTKVMRVKEISERASAYGIPGKTVDGNDAAAVYFAAKEAVENARAKKGPAFIECHTYRRGGHSRRDANLYRNKEEEKYWMGRDPLKIAEKKLLDAGYINEVGIKKIYEDIEKALDEAVEYAKSSPDVLPEDTLEGVYA
jgi:pyruvate dehydrogenase E1 component alpha subunit